MCTCFEEACYEKLHYESRLHKLKPKTPLFHGHDFTVFPNELLTTN